LNIGDLVRAADGSCGAVETVTVIDEQQTMYNLTISLVATYLVGEQGWVVHNKDGWCRFASEETKYGEGLSSFAAAYRYVNDILTVPAKVKGGQKVVGNVVVARFDSPIPEAAWQTVRQDWDWIRLPYVDGDEILIIPNILKTQLGQKAIWGELDFLGGGVHSEEMLTGWINDSYKVGVNSNSLAASVRELYSELQPCSLPGHNCSRLIADILPQFRYDGNLDVQWSHIWKPGTPDAHIRVADVMGYIKSQYGV
ncbi:MAG: nucleic acid/nucleotide deaminase domain-containing protein, partial [Bacteroidota bacterium]